MFDPNESPDQYLKRLVEMYRPQPKAPAAPMSPPSPMPLPGVQGGSVAPVGPAVSGPSQREAADQAELSRLQQTGSGVQQLEQRRPGLGRVARVGDIALGALFPNVAAAIPGTTAHHAALMANQRAAIGKEEAEEQEAAKTGLEEAQATAALQGKPGSTPEETTIHDLMTGNNGMPRTNPQTGQPYSYLDAYTAVSQAKQDTKPETHPPVGKDSAKQYNDSILRELGVNPKTASKAVPPEYEVKDTDTDAQAKEKLERAKDLVTGATGQQKIVVDAGKTSTGRSDRGYALQSGRLDKIRQPLTQSNQRVGRLVDTIDQKNPQADALIAPELLSIMAGGQGSGVRMNQAEIERIAGGRSGWENLKAAVQHWSTDPNAARSITPAQDEQIRNLVGAVKSKLDRKMQIMDAADDKLLDEDDPKEQRRVVAQAQKDIDAIDAGEAGPTHSFTYNGQRYENVPDDLYNKYKGKPGFSE